MRRLAILLTFAGLARGASAETVLVAAGSAATYLANAADPGLGTTWTAEGFDASSWSPGTFGLGYETAPPGATSLLSTPVAAGTISVYARATFPLADPSAIGALRIGADHDDGWAAWLNGVEIHRSAGMPLGALTWNSVPTPHESSNGSSPVYTPLVDVTAAGLPALHSGTNVLAVAVWNTSASSSDLVLVPQLSYSPPAGPAVVRGPYLQKGNETSVTVRWRTDVPTDARVRYGTSPESLGSSADQATIGIDHVVELSGLAAGTTHWYSVGTTGATLAGDSSFTFRTPPSAGSGRPFRAWVIGDSGTANAEARAVRDAYTAWSAGRPADLFLMLGDNAYPVGTDAQYQAAVFETYPETLRKTVLFSTYGNHDSYSADSSTQSGPYYDLFTFPTAGECGGAPSGSESYYSFDWSNVHFVCLDAMDAAMRAPDGPMTTWLLSDLASTEREWLVAFWHHPPYTKGSHDSDTETELIDMRQRFLPILEAAGVDLVLAGHSHSYERSYLIDGHYGLSSTFTAAMKKDPGDGNPAGTGPYRKEIDGLIPHLGTVHAVAGSSGKTSGGPFGHPAMVVSLNVLGSMVLDVSGGRLDATFLDDAGVVRDAFTLLKGAPAPRPVPDGAAVPGAASTARKLDASGSSVEVTWDVASCRRSTTYELIHGAGSALAGSTPSGAVCAIGNAGTFAWTGAPAPPAGESLVWWIVVGTDGASAEGSWGTDSAGAERHPSGPSGFCGTTFKVTSNPCP